VNINRRVGVAWLLLAALVCTGAECVPKSRRIAQQPQLEDLIAQINKDQAELKALYATDATVTATVGGRTYPTLGAKLAVERDRKLRLIGQTVLTGKEVDLGSNDDMFWFWVRRNSPPAVYYCNHEQFARSPIREQFPMNPTWVLEAVGMTALDPSWEHSGPEQVGKDRWQITTLRPGPGGLEKKVTIVDAFQGWIVEQQLFNAQGQLLATALASDHLSDAPTGAVVPRTVELRWPAGAMSLRVKLGNVKINELGNDPSGLFTPPELPEIPKINLAAIPGLGPPTGPSNVPQSSSAPPGPFSPQNPFHPQDQFALPGQTSSQGQVFPVNQPLPNGPALHAPQ